MLAFVSTGRSEPLVALSEVDEPQVAPHEALVEVTAYSLNRGEMLRLDRSGQGARPGQDVAGRVLRAASDGSGPPEGTRIVGHAQGGAWAERVALPTSCLAAVPGEVTNEQAAALPLAGLTALRLVETIGGRLDPMEGGIRARW